MSAGNSLGPLHADSERLDVLQRAKQEGYKQGYEVGAAAARGGVDAAGSLIEAYDRSGLTDLRWFAPYVEALRDAIGGQS